MSTDSYVGQTTQPDIRNQERKEHFSRVDVGVEIDNYIKHDRKVYTIAKKLKADGRNRVLMQDLEVETDYQMPTKFLNQKEAKVCAWTMETRMRHITDLHGSFHNSLSPNYTLSYTRKKRRWKQYGLNAEPLMIQRSGRSPPKMFWLIWVFTILWRCSAKYRWRTLKLLIILLFNCILSNFYFYFYFNFFQCHFRILKNFFLNNFW